RAYESPAPRSCVLPLTQSSIHPAERVEVAAQDGRRLARGVGALRGGGVGRGTTVGTVDVAVARADDEVGAADADAYLAPLLGLRLARGVVAEAVLASQLLGDVRERLF